METSSNQKTYALFAAPAARKLVNALEEAGAKLFQFAPVGTEKIVCGENDEIVRERLNEFQWIVFPDVFAVEYFLEILQENELDPFELDHARVLALGEAVSDRLRFVQLHADIIPPTTKTNKVLSSLFDYLGKDDLKDLKFLFPREMSTDVQLKNSLIAAGAEVTELGVYRADVPEKNKSANLKALLKGGAIDEFIVSSPEDIVSLKHYLSTEDLAGEFADIRFSGVDEVSMQTLREHELRPGFFQIKRKEAEK